MIETYMDRADAVIGFRATPSRPANEDPRYWAGHLYATVIDRMAAEARAKVRWEIATATNDHRREIRMGIRAGSFASLFTKEGRRK